ncbi:MAG: hypothetical protein AAF429_03650 [Pseudomonadota bacterium]
MNHIAFDSFDFKKDLSSFIGAVAFLFVDDDHWLKETIDHLNHLGFSRIYAIGPKVSDFKHESEALVWLTLPQIYNEVAVDILNTTMSDLVGHWVYYCFNGEFLHFPFDETRKIDDFTAFLAEERRVTALSTKIDIYPGASILDLKKLKVSQCWLDQVGYYSNIGRDQFNNQIANSLNVQGGFRWRLAEHLPVDSQTLNRNSIFFPQHKLRLLPNFNFSSLEYETAHAAWHRSPTTVTASIRAYKYLREHNRADDFIGNLKYKGSLPYQQRGRQFLELGFMEPGQWF